MQTINGSRNKPGPRIESPTSDADKEHLEGRVLPFTQDSLPHKASLIATKLGVPRVRRRLVRRPHLVALLNASQEHPLTLVAAPAGYGKTTLLSEWARQSKCPTAWFSIDQGDNDPVRFWTYFLMALHQLKGDCGADALAVLQAVGAELSEPFLTALSNDLSRLDEPITLVLDDYHLIDSDAINGAMAFLIEHLPEPVHLIISGRTVPPLPMARWIARDQVKELDKSLLRFELQEASEFFQLAGLANLSPKDIAAAHAKTEGWVAGLQLVAHSVTGRADASRFIGELNGSQHLINDYLTQEVLAQQALDVQEFLLKTSILEYLCPSLCASVTGQDEHQARRMLEGLDQANLFMFVVDDLHEWRRYHHFFAQLLRHRLRQTYPGLVPELYRRASIWYEQANQFDEAVQIALDGGDFERAAQLVEMQREIQLEGDQLPTLLNWTERLPDELVRARPGLCLARAWPLVAAGRRSEAESYLEGAEQIIQGDAGLEDAEARSLTGEVEAVRATGAGRRHDVPGTIASAERALALLPEDRRFMHRFVQLLLTLAYGLVHDLPAARRTFTAVLDSSRRREPLTLTLGYLNVGGEIERRAGHLHAAAEAMQQVLQLTRTKAGVWLPSANSARLSYAPILYEWNDLESAIGHLEDVLKEPPFWHLAALITVAYFTLGRARQVQSDLPGARAAYRKAFELSKVTGLQTHLPLSAVQVCLEEGCLDARMDSAPDRVQALLRQQQFDPSEEYEWQLTASLLLLTGNPDQAAHVLEILSGVHEGYGVRSTIETLVLQALVLRAQDRPNQARAALNRALELAEPEGYIRLFVDQGMPMLGLLEGTKSSGRMTGYVNKLLGAFATPARAAGPDLTLPAEPLTNREIELLRLIAVGLSTLEASRQMVVTVETVRTYLKKIYHKLEVHTRDQAVARARALELL